MNAAAASRWLIAALFVAAGIAHLHDPATFVAIVPAALPWPRALVAISGVAELAGGIGLLLARSRRMAGLGLVALLIAVFPANVHMAVHRLALPGHAAHPLLNWLRLPLQPLLIAWVWWAGVRRTPTARGPDPGDHHSRTAR